MLPPQKPESVASRCGRRAPGHRCFPLAVYDKLPAANLDVRVRFKAVPGSLDRAGATAIRLADPNHYYVAHANALEENVNFYHVANGVRREIRGASADQEFAISLNRKPMFAVQDRTFTNPGKVAGRRQIA